jgi:hypothetical protein
MQQLTMNLIANRTAPIATLAALLLLGGYVAAYFACSDYYEGGWSEPVPSLRIRSFPNETAATIFAPIVKLESIVRGHDIMVVE